MSVMRMWRGAVRTEDLDAYVSYVAETGLASYRQTKGNLGADILTRDLEDGRSEIVTMSRWDSRDSIRAFAGDDIGMAVFYPDDDRWLVDRDLFVTHFDIADA